MFFKTSHWHGLLWGIQLTSKISSCATHSVSVDKSMDCREIGKLWLIRNVTFEESMVK